MQLIWFVEIKFLFEILKSQKLMVAENGYTESLDTQVENIQISVWRESRKKAGTTC